MTLTYALRDSARLEAVSNGASTPWARAGGGRRMKYQLSREV